MPPDPPPPPPPPPSMASRLLRTQENTSCFKYGEEKIYIL